MTKPYEPISPETAFEAALAFVGANSGDGVPDNVFGRFDLEALFREPEPLVDALQEALSQRRAERALVAECFRLDDPKDRTTSGVGEVLDGGRWKRFVAVRDLVPKPEEVR